jgi:hypothetical protein
VAWPPVDVNVTAPDEDVPPAAPFGAVVVVVVWLADVP